MIDDLINYLFANGLKFSHDLGNDKIAGENLPQIIYLKLFFWMFHEL